LSAADREILELAGAETGDCLDRIEATLLEAEGGHADAEAIDSMFRDAHSIKGTASMVGWKEVASIASTMEDTLGECRETGEFPAKLAAPLLKATDAARKALADESGSGAGPTNEQSAGADVVAPAAPSAPTASRRGIRVGAEKVDRMLDAVGETVLHHRRLEHVLGERIVAAGDDIAEEELGLGERLLDELQDSVIEMRTLPLSSITGSFPRAVRDVATAEGKEVELVITGAETQLDRVILEGISDAITHLLRNAVAHGIESPKEREAAGKPAIGRVELRAGQREGMVAIEVADDGGGVSQELLERGEEVGSLADVLAAPGFSTAAEVTELAGRGVGLDAVKEHVESLAGSLEIRSEPGRGTETILLLPLTLALLRVLLCERGGQPFGVPLPSVREVVLATDVTSLSGRPSIERHGESISLADLAAMLGTSAPPLPSAPTAMIIASSARSVAVACDRVLGDQEVVVKTLGPLLAGVNGYLGAAILGDGRVALILDPNHLLKTQVAASLAVEAPAGQADEERSAPTVLVVDDQFTVRELQRSILETSGYRVETARNGREALERLAAVPEIDIVLTDVEMPEMDGFALLAAIRQHADRSSLPVVVISALEGEEDRRRGIEQGADAYIVKQEFDQQTLLDTILRLVGS